MNRDSLSEIDQYLYDNQHFLFLYLKIVDNSMLSKAVFTISIRLRLT